jgi:SAM-dependent methyltransferase
MPIHRVDNFIDAYRVRAAAPDLHALSGRGTQHHLTAYVNAEICRHLRFEAGDVVVDVGCGDGSLLASISGGIRQGIGVAPTREEVSRLRREHAGRENLCFVVGRAESLPLRSGIASKVVCNGVLLLLDDLDALRRAVSELRRVAGPDARVFIGEVPDVDEAALAREAYGDSLWRWLVFSIRRDGWRSGLRVARTIARGALSREPLVIQPKRCTFVPPEAMRALLAALPWTLAGSAPYRPPSAGLSGASRRHYLLETGGPSSPP